MPDLKKGTDLYTSRDMPSFQGMKAYVTPGAFVGSIRRLLLEAGFEAATTWEEADVVCFSGGSDISPTLYNEKPIPATYPDAGRDTLETVIYHHCLNNDKYMFGICRGAQFLHAMNGGRLWQDVRGHAGRDHLIVDLDDDVKILATSIHHQMLRANNRLKIVAVTEEQISKRFEAENEVSLIASADNYEIEIEAGYYEDTGCFFVQGHPEVGSPEYRSWTMKKLHNTYSEWKQKKEAA